jgi:hypothetical protein
VKFSNNAQAALQKPDTKAVTIEMTPELREKYHRVTGKVVELLRAETEGPMEAYLVLQFVLHAFEDRYGIRGGVIVENGDQAV